MSRVIKNVAELKEKAAALDADGKLSAIEIAKLCDVNPRTVFNWRALPDYQAHVRRLQNEWRERARNRGIADQDERLRDLNDRHKRLRAVMQQRARDPQFKNVPGGNTGLLTVKYKMRSLGRGESIEVPEYEVDTAMLAEMRAIEQHAAIELGQWKTKSEHSETKTMDASPAAIALAKLMTPAQLREMDERLKAIEEGTA